MNTLYTSETTLTYKFENVQLANYNSFMAPAIHAALVEKYPELDNFIGFNYDQYLFYSYSDTDMSLDFEYYRHVLEDTISNFCEIIIKHLDVLDEFMDFSDDVEFREYILTLDTLNQLKPVDLSELILSV